MEKIKNDENLIILGISGYATSGKDTFAKIAQNLLKDRQNTDCHIFNFAADLKVIADSIIRPYLGIDCFYPSPEDKKHIRKILVGIGQGFRDVDEFFWVKRVAEKINKLDLNKINFVLIPDNRNINECEWVKSHKNGFIVSITRDGIVPPNDHEAENIPLIASKFADFSVSWSNIGNCEENILTNHKLVGIVEETLGKIYAKQT